MSSFAATVHVSPSPSTCDINDAAVEHHRPTERMSFHYRRSVMRGLSLLLPALVVTVAGCSLSDGAGPTPSAPLTSAGPSSSLSVAPTPSVDAETSPAAPLDAAPLDALAISLEIGEPRGRGQVPTRIRVQNLTSSSVVDPGCRRFANYTAGVADPASPETFIGGSVGLVTKCTGAETLPPGYDETRAGPTLPTRKLGAGTYVAVVDYGDARTELLTRRFTLPAR